MSNLPMVFSKDPYFNDHGSFYRPVQTLTFMLDAHFFSEKGTAFYLTNLILHASTGCFLYVLLILLSNNRLSSFMVTLLFLGHPLFVHTVAWIPGRGDLLAGMFTIMATIWFLKFFNERKWYQGLLSLLWYCLALFSKETAIMLVPVLVIIIVSKGGFRDLKSLSLATLGAGFVFITACFLFLRAQVVGSLPAGEFGIIPFLHNLRSLPEYFAKIILPVNLSPMPAYSYVHTMVGILALTLTILILARNKQSFGIIPWWGLFWFFLFLLPGLAYTHPLGSKAYDYLEHRVYLPAAGIMMIVHSMVSSPSTFLLTKKWTGIRLIFFLIPVVVIMTLLHLSKYKDPLSFYDRAIATNPGSAVALYNRGCLKIDLMDYTGALTDLNLACRIEPGYSQAWHMMGVAQFHLHDYDAAITDYNQALHVNPRLFEAQFDLAAVLLEKGDIVRALPEFDKAISLVPNYGPSYSRRGFIYFRKKEYSKAITDLDQALQYDPKDDFALVTKGRAQYLLGDTLGACTSWHIAARIGNEGAIGLIRKYCK